jgi:hydrogenase maturation factor HypF (carbamoyltransferase family)
MEFILSIGIAVIIGKIIQDLIIMKKEKDQRNYFKTLSEDVKEDVSTGNILICYRCRKEAKEAFEIIHANLENPELNYIESDVSLCEECFNKIMRKA